MENQDDIKLVERVLRGEADAFRGIVEKYQQMVFTIAFRILAIREDAEDAAQEAFVKCYSSLHTFNGKSAFSTWIYKIAYNHSLDVLRSRRRKGINTDWEKSQVDTLIPESDSVEDSIDIKAVQNVVKSAIDRLPADDRIIVLLYYYENLPLRDIAEIAGIKENNVKIKLHRIRGKLTKILRSKSEFVSILNLCL